MMMVQVGLLINSALYLALVFIAGLVTQDALAWQGAIATAGICFLGYMAQDFEQRGVAILLVVASVVVGAGAGIALLV